MDMFRASSGAGKKKLICAMKIQQDQGRETETGAKIWKKNEYIDCVQDGKKKKQFKRSPLLL